jgi:hypothetical protein
VHKLWRSVSRFNVQTAPEGDSENSGYRVMESDERAHSVTERRQYPRARVVPVCSKASQCSNIHALAVIHRAESLASVSLGRPDGAPEGEARSSGYRVTESDKRTRSVTFGDESTAIPPSGVRKASQCSNFHSLVAHEREIHLFAPLTHSVNRLPGSVFENLFARALLIWLLTVTHSPHRCYI